MINILFDCPNEQNFISELKPYVKSGSKVVVVAFSYYDDFVFDSASWKKVYGKGGVCYEETVNSLRPYGIKENDIYFINFFERDLKTATQKIKRADVVYFTGGLPDKMMQRIKIFGIFDALKKFNGTVMGYSAGAVIQLKRYHLSPDGDYPAFGYYEGLGYVDGFFMEVHYENKPEQNESIDKVLAENKNPLYVSPTAGGGLIVSGGKIITVGKTYKKMPNS